MTTTPHWSPVDDETADLLSVIADDGTLTTEVEWEMFVETLRGVALRAFYMHGTWDIKPNVLRPRLRDRVKPQRIGAFTTRALAQGLIEWRGEWEVSDDTSGRNSGKPAKSYVWVGAA